MAIPSRPLLLLTAVIGENHPLIRQVYVVICMIIFEVSC